jgi:hypothetical protein
MPVLFAFAKEDDQFIQSEEKNLRQQIQNLPDIPIVIGQQQFCLQVRIRIQDHSFYINFAYFHTGQYFQAKEVTVYSTMWDGKSLTAIAKTYLPTGKKLASSACHLCLANRDEMSRPDVWERQIRQGGCSILILNVLILQYLFGDCKLLIQLFT